MGSPGKLTHLEIKIPILRVHIMTFLFYPAVPRRTEHRGKREPDKYRNNNRAKYTGLIGTGLQKYCNHRARSGLLHFFVAISSWDSPIRFQATSRICMRDTSRTASPRLINHQMHENGWLRSSRGKYIPRTSLSLSRFILTNFRNSLNRHRNWIKREKQK